MNKYRYIVVEGPIGAGKTSLARLLSDRFRMELMLEDTPQNPFLHRFYEEPGRHALATQLFFLFQRSNQVRDLAQMDLFSQATVSDFLLDKDMLFAKLNLDDEEYRLYQHIYGHLRLQTIAPDLVIYLQAPAEVLVERVRKRAVAYERAHSADYLRRVAEGYSRFFHEYEASPVLIVNSANFNFADNPNDLDLLVQRIEAMRGGRQFFNRAG